MSTQLTKTLDCQIYNAFKKSKILGEIMFSKFNMFPIVEGKESRASLLGKAAIISGFILTFVMHMVYKEDKSHILAFLSEVFVAYFLLDYLFLSLGNCIKCNKWFGKKARIITVFLALVALIFTLLLCILEQVTFFTLLPYSAILMYAIVGYRNYNNAKN